MGREKIKMQKIDDIAARQVTFSKRRQGLVKKAHELSILCEAEVALIVFSPAGRLYHYSSSNIKDILNKFSLHLNSGQHPVKIQGKNRKHANLNRGVEDKINYLRHIRTEYLQHFSKDELQQIETELEEILTHVSVKKREHLMDEVPALQKKGSQTTDTIRTQSGETSCSANEILERWIPPPPDVYKVNFAGVNFHDANASGVGVVIRNWRGEFMAALARFFPELTDQNIASLVAAKCAIQFAVDYCFTQIMLEADAPNTINEIQNTYEAQSPASTAIMQETMGYMRQLGSCSFLHVQTSGNTAAHMVAQYARNVGDELVWLMKEPDFLGDVLLTEFNLTIDAVASGPSMSKKVSCLSMF